MKKPLKKLAKFILYILVIAVPSLIALKCGKMNQAKKLKESPNNYDNLQESSSFDKVSNTTNKAKLKALDEMYNYELNNEKP